jgi:hypothetical protein
LFLKVFSIALKINNNIIQLIKTCTQNKRECKMTKIFIIVFSLLIFISSGFSSVTFQKSDQQIDVIINGQLFTSYVYSDNQPKPILVPLQTPTGIPVNRRTPLTKMAGGSDDHPHHIGLFFAVDQVNGTNFWKNSTLSPQIKHVSIDEINGGTETGTLVATSHWTNEKGVVVLEERRSMVFSGTNGANNVDLSISLTALEPEVVFEDIEEGMFAIRLADALRESGSKVIPAPGQPLPKESVDGTGQYITSNGDVGAAEGWGKRARWVALTGIKEKNIVGVAIFNHPESYNYPTYWHIRGYGLFSANPLGQGDFIRQSPYQKNPNIPLNLTLTKGQSVYFRFLVSVFEGRQFSKDLETSFKKYIKE